MHHVISLLVLLKLLLGCAPTHSACDRKSLWTQSRALPRGFSVCHAVTLQRRVMLPGCTFVKWTTTTTTRTHDQSVLTDKLPSFWLFVVSLASTLLEEGGGARLMSSGLTPSVVSCMVCTPKFPALNLNWRVMGWTIHYTVQLAASWKLNDKTCRI